MRKDPFVVIAGASVVGVVSTLGSLDIVEVSLPIVAKEVGIEFNGLKENNGGGGGILSKGIGEVVTLGVCERSLSTLL